MEELLLGKAFDNILENYYGETKDDEILTLCLKLLLRSK